MPRLSNRPPQMRRYDGNKARVSLNGKCFSRFSNKSGEARLAIRFVYAAVFWSACIVVRLHINHIHLGYGEAVRETRVAAN